MRIPFLIFFSIFVLISFVGCSKPSFKPQFDAKTTPQIGESAIYKPIGWRDLPNWKRDDHEKALKSFIRSCEAMASDSRWKLACKDAVRAENGDKTDARIFFERHFLPYQVLSGGGKKEGLITGYYLPVIKGSFERTKRYRYPIYKRPSSLVEIDLVSLNLGKGKKFAMLDQGKIVPFFSRAEIEADPSPLAGEELIYVDDPIALFFLHIQGSGFVELDDGSRVGVGYDGQNGHRYYAIGGYMIKEGLIKKEDISLQSIRDYLVANPADKTEILHKNPSYIFFRELNSTDSAYGSQGVLLSSKRSAAVDRAFVPLGSPIYISTKHPQKSHNFEKLVIAQDTGGAIKGAVRADFFWGLGDEAEELAGKTKSNGNIWILIPKENL